jgi:hypothetical protein
MVLPKTDFRSSNWLRMLSLWIQWCTLRSINLGSFWIKDLYLSAAWANIFRHLHTENCRWVKWSLITSLLAHFVHLKKFGSCGPFTLNEIPKESRLKEEVYSPNAMKPRIDGEYNSDLFLSFPVTAHQLSQNSSENSKNLRSHKLFFQELRESKIHWYANSKNFIALERQEDISEVRLTRKRHVHNSNVLKRKYYVWFPACSAILYIYTHCIKKRNFVPTRMFHLPK